MSELITQTHDEYIRKINIKQSLQSTPAGVTLERRIREVYKYKDERATLTEIIFVI